MILCDKNTKNMLTPKFFLQKFVLTPKFFISKIGLTPKFELMSPYEFKPASEIMVFKGSDATALLEKLKEVKPNEKMF